MHLFSLPAPFALTLIIALLPSIPELHALAFASPSPNPDLQPQLIPRDGQDDHMNPTMTISTSPNPTGSGNDGTCSYDASTGITTCVGDHGGDDTNGNDVICTTDSRGGQRCDGDRGGGDRGGDRGNDDDRGGDRTGDPEYWNGTMSGSMMMTRMPSTMVTVTMLSNVTATESSETSTGTGSGTGTAGTGTTGAAGTSGATATTTAPAQASTGAAPAVLVATNEMGMGWAVAVAAIAAGVGIVGF